MIVDSFPFLNQILRLHHRVHDFPGELLPPELSIEGFDESVLPRCPRVDEHGVHPGSGTLVDERPGGEIRAVIAWGVSQDSAGLRDDVFPHHDHIGGFEGPARNDRQGGTGGLVEDVENRVCRPPGVTSN